jgi:hypothetical protein
MNFSFRAKALLLEKFFSLTKENQNAHTQILPVATARNKITAT